MQRPHHHVAVLAPVSQNRCRQHKHEPTAAVRQRQDRPDGRDRYPAVDHAARLAGEADVKGAAPQRMLDHYLHTAFAAARLMEPDREPIALPEPTAHPDVIADAEQVHEWFDTERSVLFAMVRYAADTGFDAHAWRLAWTLTDDLNRRGLWQDWVAVGRIAVASPKSLNSDAATARAHRFLAFALIRLHLLDRTETYLSHTFGLHTATGDVARHTHAHSATAYVADRRGRYDDALFHSERALALFRSAGHRAGEANALNSVGWCHLLAGRYDTALTRCREALTVFAELNDRTGVGGTWDSIGGTLRRLERYDEAIDAYWTRQWPVTARSTTGTCKPIRCGTWPTANRPPVATRNRHSVRRL
ncbi:MAG TPA: tetratricopeptide repeat protein [Candidatus Stackebrandtia excrementipullorum]|nr:tetratricopeptide repeat protein [Candidatus Stackebrandtia excrementipullorum]